MAEKYSEAKDCTDWEVKMTNRTLCFSFFIAFLVLANLFVIMEMEGVGDFVALTILFWPLLFLLVFRSFLLILS